MEPSHLSVSDDDVLSRLLLSDAAAAAIAIVACDAAATAATAAAADVVVVVDADAAAASDVCACGSFVVAPAAAPDPTVTAAAMAAVATATALVTATVAAATFRLDADEEHALLLDVCRSAEDCDQCEEARDSISLSSRNLRVVCVRVYSSGHVRVVWWLRVVECACRVRGEKRSTE